MKLEGKRMHGQFSRSLDEKRVDKEQSYRWFKFGDITGETEVQQWQLRIRHSVQTAWKKYMKEETEGKCRLCKEYRETTDHLRTGHPILAKNEDMIDSAHIYTTQYARH
jgi:hypothetical protein